MDTTFKPVVVTTEHRGVFFGYVPDGSAVLAEGESATVELTKARNILYWSADVKGFLGLASTGPTTGCRVGPSVSSLVLNKVTSIVTATPEAAEAWEAGPWSR